MGRSPRPGGEAHSPSKPASRSGVPLSCSRMCRVPRWDGLAPVPGDREQPPALEPGTGHPRLRPLRSQGRLGRARRAAGNVPQPEIGNRFPTLDRTRSRSSLADDASIVAWSGSILTSLRRARGDATPRTGRPRAGRTERTRWLPPHGVAPRPRSVRVGAALGTTADGLCAVRSIVRCGK